MNKAQPGLFISGGMQDWNYLHTNCFELTIEMGCVKYPTADRLPAFWQANKFSLLVFMGQVSMLLSVYRCCMSVRLKTGKGRADCGGRK